MVPHFVTLDTKRAVRYESLARTAYDCLEWVGENDPAGRRANIVVTKDGTPDWVTDVIYAAHGEMLPDDRTYSLVQDALELIANGASEDSDHEFADSAVDVYTSDRFAWLASNLNRQSYVDEARESGLADPDSDIADLIGAGQYVEAQTVYAAVYRALEDHLADVEAESDDDGSDASS